MADPELGAGINTARKFPASFDAPLLLFLISAAGGVWIAYDKPVAWTKFALIVVGLALYVGLTHCPERIRLGQWGEASLPQWILGSLPALVAVYFLLTNDWAARLGKVPVLDPAMRWFAAWQPNVASLRLNSNVIGGVIAALIPLQIAALFQGHSGRLLWFKALLAGLAAIGLLMSASRGAWLALAVVMVGWALWQVMRHWAARLRLTAINAQAIWIVVLVVVIAAVVLFIAQTPWGERLLSLRTDRLEVWQNSLDLVNDYAFTGLGLGNFEMAYSSYVLLVQVPHTAHAHNLFLDIWLENGLLGLLAMAGILVIAIAPLAQENVLTRRWWPAAFTSFGVILLHGLVDDAFYGYEGWAVVLMFLPLAMMARDWSTGLQGSLPAIVLWTCSAVALAAACFTPTIQAAFKANVGAVAQTQVELTNYHWPESVFQDVVRRSSQARLQSAIAWYRSAKAADPNNATANRRLGQIELAFGQYDAACQHLSLAYAAAPSQRATRQLLGECFALAGNIGEARSLWETIDMHEGQLQLRQWWYAEYLGDKDNAARLVQAMPVPGTN